MIQFSVLKFRTLYIDVMYTPQQKGMVDVTNPRIAVSVAAAAIVFGLAAVVSMGGCSAKVAEQSSAQVWVVAPPAEQVCVPVAADNRLAEVGEAAEAANADWQPFDSEEMGRYEGGFDDSPALHSISRGDPDCACLVERNGKPILKGVDDK